MKMDFAGMGREGRFGNYAPIDKTCENPMHTGFNRHISQCRNCELELKELRQYPELGITTARKPEKQELIIVDGVDSERLVSKINKKMKEGYRIIGGMSGLKQLMILK